MVSTHHNYNNHDIIITSVEEAKHINVEPMHITMSQTHVVREMSRVNTQGGYDDFITKL